MEAMVGMVVRLLVGENTRVVQVVVVGEGLHPVVGLIVVFGECLFELLLLRPSASICLSLGHTGSRC